jgi:hypothetical protein
MVFGVILTAIGDEILVSELRPFHAAHAGEGMVRRHGEGYGVAGELVEMQAAQIAFTWVNHQRQL